MKTGQRTYNLGYDESTKQTANTNATDADDSADADVQRPLALDCPTCGTILPIDVRQEWNGECVRSHCRRVSDPQEVGL